MPFKVMEVESDTENPAVTERNVKAEVKTLTPGQAVTGFIGTAREEPISEPEQLSKEERKRKQSLKQFLAKYITPPELSQNRPNPQRDRVAFMQKLDKQTLGELRRFWNKTEIPDELDEDAIIELNDKWRNLSP
jgi:hypothetical protein